MQSTCHLSRTWRLRFTVVDEADRLAAATACLAEVGIDILSLHVVASATEVAADATVTLPQWLDVPAVEHALLATGASEVRAFPIPVRQTGRSPRGVATAAPTHSGAGGSGRTTR